MFENYSQKSVVPQTVLSDPLQPVEALERYGGFARMMAGLAAEAEAPKTIMVDATTLKAHRTASGLRAKKGAMGAAYLNSPQISVRNLRTVHNRFGISSETRAIALESDGPRWIESADQTHMRLVA